MSLTFNVVFILNSFICVCENRGRIFDGLDTEMYIDMRAGMSDGEDK